MSRNNNKTRLFPCVLKTIINDAHRDNKSFTLNDKQIRSRLRAKMNDAHIRNTSWIATNSREYDAMRCAFDVAYATKIANAKTSKRRTSKRATSTNVDVVETNDA
jgi:hypothetical protein